MYMEDRNSCTVFCMQLSLWFSLVKQVWLQMFIHNHCELHAIVYLFPHWGVPGMEEFYTLWNVIFTALTWIQRNSPLCSVWRIWEIQRWTSCFFPDDLLCVFPLGFLSVISVIPKGRKSWHAQKSCQMFLWKWIWNAFFYCVLCEHCVCKRAWERLLALEMVFFCTGKCQKLMHLFSKNKS